MALIRNTDGTTSWEHGEADIQNPVYQQREAFRLQQEANEKQRSMMSGSFAKSNNLLNQQNQTPKVQLKSSPQGGFVKGIINIIVVFAVAYFFVRWIQHH